MRKSFKRFVAVILMIALCSSTFAVLPASAADAKRDYSKKITVYIPVKAAQMYNTFILDISTSNISKSIKRSSVKISDESVACIDSLSDHDINLEIKKAGTVTISFKAGSKTYTCKVTAKAHVNPIQTLKISGVKNRKNIIGKYKRKANGLFYATISETTQNAKITVQPKDGWGLKYVHLADNQGSNSRILDKSYAKPVSSKKTYSIGPFREDKSYTLSVCCENLKNGSEVFEYYILNNCGRCVLSLDGNGALNTVC